MTSLPDHRQMISLRGEEYVFELKGMMPDGLSEMYRQLYMDSFLLFVLPVDVETIGNFRAKSVRKVLNVLTSERFHKVPSNVLSMRIDKTVWQLMFKKYLPQGQVEPAFPWPIPRADPAAPPSPMLQEWRQKMGLSCEYETLKDSSSTDSILSNVVRLSTQEKIQEFLEEQQLMQWYTTRATLPKKPANPVQQPHEPGQQGQQAPGRARDNRSYGGGNLARRGSSRVSRQERSASRDWTRSRSRDHNRASNRQRSLTDSESEVDEEFEIRDRRRSPHSSHGRSHGRYSTESRYHRSPSRYEHRRNRSRSPSRYEHRRNRERSPSRYEHRRNRSRSPSQHEHRHHRSRSPRPHGNQRRRATPSRRREESAFSRSETRGRSSTTHPATNTTTVGGRELTLRSRPVDRISFYDDGSSELCAINNSVGGGAQSNIYTLSRDVDTGQAVYDMVTDDPKLRDVNILGRPLQKESTSGMVSVRMMAVHGRRSRRDPKKLLWNSEARARADRNSYEVIEDDNTHEVDLSMGRDEQSHRMNVEPQHEGQDMEMTGSTAGLSSATEAQSNTTATAMLASSLGRGIDDSVVTSQPATTATATVMPSFGGDLAMVHARQVLTAVHAARPTLDLQQARSFCRPVQRGHWTDDEEERAAIEVGASEDMRDFSAALDGLSRTPFIKMMALLKVCMRIFHISPLEAFSPDYGINLRRGIAGRRDRIMPTHPFIWAQPALSQLHSVMLHPLFISKDSLSFLIIALQFAVICRTRDIRPWNVPLMGPGSAIPQIDTLRDLFRHATTGEDGTASHPGAPYELLRNFCAQIPPEQVTAEASLLLEVSNIVMPRKTAGTLATADQHGVMQYEVYMADIEAIINAIDHVQPPQVSVKVASATWGGLPNNMGRFTGQPDSHSTIDILKLSYEHLMTRRLLRDRSLVVQHGSTADAQVLQPDPPLNQSITVAHEETYEPPPGPPPGVAHEEIYEPPLGPPPGVAHQLNIVPSDHFRSMEGSPGA